MMQESTNLLVTDQHADDLPVLGEDEAFLYDNNRIRIEHSDLQGMIDYSMIRYEENTMRQLSDRMIRNTMNTLLKTTAREATKGDFDFCTKVWMMLSTML